MLHGVDAGDKSAQRRVGASPAALISRDVNCKRVIISSDERLNDNEFSSACLELKTEKPLFKLHVSRKQLNYGHAHSPPESHKICRSLLYLFYDAQFCDRASLNYIV